MNARIVSLSLAFVAVMAVGVLVAQDHAQNVVVKEIPQEKPKFEASCPISGGPAVETSFVEVDGKKVYFCCENCPTAYKAEPEKFAAAANYQLLQTKQAIQVGCPLSGGPVNAEATVKVGTIDVAFCCEDCQTKVAEMEQKEQVSTVFTSLEKGFTTQTKCPISGHDIAVDQSAEHEDKTIYFCCADCVTMFKEDPSKFADKIAPPKSATQGVDDKDGDK